MRSLVGRRRLTIQKVHVVHLVVVYQEREKVTKKERILHAANVTNAVLLLGQNQEEKLTQYLHDDSVPDQKTVNAEHAPDE